MTYLVFMYVHDVCMMYKYGMDMAYIVCELILLCEKRCFLKFPA